jgi:hypothetical protein
MIDIIGDNSEVTSCLHFNSISINKCQCGHKSYVVAPHTYLILKFEMFNNNQAIDIKNLLHYHQSWNNLENDWRCNSNCNLQKQTKNIILNIPQYLVVQLARYDNNRNKIFQTVTFPLENFELDSINGRGSFGLCAILCHEGISIDGGN